MAVYPLMINRIGVPTAVGQKLHHLQCDLRGGGATASKNTAKAAVL
jgi:hypothetical protein